MGFLLYNEVSLWHVPGVYPCRSGRQRRTTMREYALITDSTCDLPQKIVDELDIYVVNLSFIMDGKSYAGTLDSREMPITDYYAKLRAGGSSSTAQINSEEFIREFEPILQGGRDILYIAFSSGLSGTCQSAMIARKELEEKYPQRRVVVFDSRCASMGQGLLVYQAGKQRQGGADLDALHGWLKAHVLKVAHWFTVDDLNFLKRGGRVSTATALVGTMLGIKPVLHVDDEGHLIPATKVRGRKQSLDQLVKKMEETAVNPASQTVMISHGDCREDADYVAAEIKRKLGTKDFLINFIGPVVGAHSGPGTVALFFMAGGR